MHFSKQVFIVTNRWWHYRHPSLQIGKGVVNIGSSFSNTHSHAAMIYGKILIECFKIIGRFWFVTIWCLLMWYVVQGYISYDINFKAWFKTKSNNVQDVLRGRRRRGYDPNDERYYVSDTNTGSLTDTCS